MKTFAALRLLVFALLCTLAWPRTGLCAGAVPDDAPVAGEEVPFRCAVGVALPLDGVTDENAAEVKRALTRMTRPRYQCPACKMKADYRATCEGCGEGFEQREVGAPLFETVRVDVPSRTACVEIARSGVVTLTALGEALRPTGVGLRRAELDIGAWTRITVRMAPGDVAKAKKALQRPGLFASVGVRVSEGSPSTSFIIQHPPRKPVTLARVAEAWGEAVPGGIVFEDVSWTAACLTCEEERGRRRGSCRVCWQAEIRREKSRDR